MKILLTAFEPFGGEQINPAQEAVKLVSTHIHGSEIIKIDVPVVFNEAGEIVYKTMKEVNPDVILCIGQAGGQVGLAVERVAINLQDARIPDNSNNQPVDKKCFDDGENALFSNLPVKSMVEHIRKANIPASISYSAGTYVCNDLMYTVLYHIRNEFTKMKGGFIHVPYSNEQVLNKPNTPSLSIKEIVKGIESAILSVIEDIEGC